MVFPCNIAHMFAASRPGLTRILFARLAVECQSNPITIGMFLQLNPVIFVKQSGFFGQFVADGVHLLAKHYSIAFEERVWTECDWMRTNADIFRLPFVDSGFLFR